MSDLATDLAEQCVYRALDGQRHPTMRARILAQTIRSASRMLAEESSHESMEFLHAAMVREHHEMRTRQGVARRGG